MKTACEGTDADPVRWFIVLDFGALPPEINSGRMYAGPGSGSMMAAAAAWDGLAAELSSTATGYTSSQAAERRADWLQ